MLTEAVRRAVKYTLLRPPLPAGSFLFGGFLNRSGCPATRVVASRLPFKWGVALLALICVAPAASAQRLASVGVRVNSISPGPVQFAGGIWDVIEAADPAFYAGVRDQIPMGRMGSAEELARLIAFVASPTSGCRFQKPMVRLRRIR